MNEIEHLGGASFARALSETPGPLIVDDQPELAAEHRIRGIPIVIRFEGGIETRRAMGALPYPELLRALDIRERQRAVA